MSKQLEILVIDDDSLDLHAIVRELKTFNPPAHVIEAKDASSGLELLKQKKIDCVLLDYHLPDLNGFEFLEKCEQLNLPSVPTIILTGNQDPETSSRAVKMGIQDYISKRNLGNERLSHAIQHSISRHKRLAELQKQKEELSEFIDAIKKGDVDVITGAETDSTMIRLQDAGLVAENEKLMAELQKKNEELELYANIASHDLKEPLRGIKTLCGVIEEDYRKKFDAEGMKLLNRLSFLSNKTQLLITDLLEYSQLNQTTPRQESTNITKIVNEVNETIKATFDDNSLHIKVLNPLPTVVCDKTSITEVFRNLITNAIKYNNKKEKIIEIGFTEVLHKDKNQQAFYVKDNGIGIEEEFHDEIFRLFRRLHSENDFDGGLGSGLTFVKKIIEQHEGIVWVDSKCGHGATFYFTLEGKK